MRLIDADALKATLVDTCSTSKNVKQRQIEDSILHGILPQIIDDEPTIEAITREHFIKEAKELITDFVGSGEKTEENSIIFALVFGNLELRLFGSSDGDSE